MRKNEPGELTAMRRELEPRGVRHLEEDVGTSRLRGIKLAKRNLEGIRLR